MPHARDLIENWRMEYNQERGSNFRSSEKFYRTTINLDIFLILFNIYTVHFLYNMVKKLNCIQVQEKLKNSGLAIFTPREFAGVFDISPQTGSIFISRNLKSGLFLKLRNNYYMLKDSNPSLYSIANKLYQPSYISLESALSHYNIIPEVVYAITSVTTKPTREFKTPKSVFSYQRIKKSVFTGYSPVIIEGNVVLLAEPEKALADYLYFVDLKKTSLNDRLNLRGIHKGKLSDFLRTFKRKSLLKMMTEIYAQQRKPREIY